MTYSIHVKILPLTVFSGHAYLELFDKNGQRVCQINGFATDVVSQKSKAVGAPWDQIKVYISKQSILAVTAHSSASQHVHKGFVLAEIEDDQKLQTLLNALQKRADEINQRQLRYKLLSQNSNAVFAEMVLVIATHLALNPDELFAKTLSIQPFLPGLQSRLCADNIKSTTIKPKKYKP